MTGLLCMLLSVLASVFEFMKSIIFDVVFKSFAM